MHNPHHTQGGAQDVAKRGGISEKQQRFAREYLVDLNATQAAIRAGYSPKTAGCQSHELLKKPEIQEIIAAGAKKAEQRTEITLDRVLNEYARIAFAGMSKFVSIDSDGTPRVDLSKCTPEDLDLLSEVQTETQQGEDKPVLKVKIKPLDKLNALEKLARHLGVFRDAEVKPIENAIAALVGAIQGSALPVAAPLATDDDEGEDE